MSKRIPIRAAKEIAKSFGMRQVILVAWSGQGTHVVTYGESLEDCDQAAMGGNRVKRALNWPESLRIAEPSRVTELKSKISELKIYNTSLTGQLEHAKMVSDGVIEVQSARIKQLEAQLRWHRDDDDDPSRPSVVAERTPHELGEDDPDILCHLMRPAVAFFYRRESCVNE